ncbi:MAG: cob(I)yrinic acid a,c-diamide adenosyltransferase [Lachnospiraceae bacterium]|nr:cob(I)yrinic acid a,c-diamide adenosyltransferase [Lachnospiraceae bacterium]
MIQIYTGNGKGKTTGAVGSAIRCVGAGKKVLFCQFLKDGTSGECSLLKTLSGVECLLPEREFGFTFTMDEETRKEAMAYYRTYWDKIEQAMAEKNYDMIVLDEICDACCTNMIDVEKVLKFLDKYGKTVEIILTGRKPSETLAEKAEYITEMKKIKHPFDKGVSARKGIEF